MLATLTPTAQSAAPTASAWSLFVQSIDVFTVVLVIGSVAAVALRVQCVREIHRDYVLPESERERRGTLSAGSPRSELASYLRTRTSFPALVLKSMLEAEDAAGKQGLSTEAARESAQLEADAQG